MPTAGIVRPARLLKAKWDTLEPFARRHNSTGWSFRCQFQSAVALSRWEWFSGLGLDVGLHKFAPRNGCMGWCCKEIGVKSHTCILFRTFPCEIRVRRFSQSRSKQGGAMVKYHFQTNDEKRTPLSLPRHLSFAASAAVVCCECDSSSDRMSVMDGGPKRRATTNAPTQTTPPKSILSQQAGAWRVGYDGFLCVRF